MLALFIEKLLAFPLWVKQVVFMKLYQDLSKYLSEDFIKVKEQDIFHLYIPTLTFIGKTELIEKKCGLDQNIYNFLANIDEGLNMLETSMNNFWTMEEVAKYYIFCLEQNYVKNPESNYVHAMAGFIAGKFRTGEYFKRSGKINVDQLEQTIVKQKQTISEGKPLKIAEIMISLGFVTEKDTSSLLIIKEEAKRRFILDTAIVPSIKTTAGSDNQQQQDEIAKLTEQNRLLKEQLNKILSFVKKNG